MKSFFVFLLLFSAAGFCQAPVEQSTAAAQSPVYVSLAQDLNQYYMNASGGWDSNWYVGYNNAWTVKLPTAPAGDYVRAFVGAKLGRAKTVALKDKPWQKVPVEGKIFMGLSQTPSFTSQQSYFLVESRDIPYESLPSETLDGVGSAQWFWAEIPLQNLAQDKPNYLALWSNSELFTDSTNSPIVAGAETRGRTEPSVWINNDMDGTSPRGDDIANATPITGLAPALALKLVPRNDLKVSVRQLAAVQTPKSVIFSFSVSGQDIRAAWLELSYDRFDWQRLGRFFYQPPYTATVDKALLPSADRFFVRAAAVDCLENTGYSQEISLK